MTLDALRTEIEQQAALMVAVATGGPQIDSKQSEYIARRKRIAGELKRLRLTDPNPYGDLWAWYGFYSANLGKYHERRTYIRELYEPLHEALDALGEREIGARLEEGERTGWERVDDQIVQLRDRYTSALTTEDFQAVGLLCRDIFVSLDEAVFDSTQHVPDGEEPPDQLVDRLLAVVEHEASGASNKELRGLLKSNIDYANKVQHDRAATRRQARIVAEVTMTCVTLFRELLRPEEAAELAAIQATWKPTILRAVSERSIPTYSVLTEAQPVELDGDTLVLRFAPSASFHRALAEEPKNARVLAEVLEEVVGRKLALTFQLGEAE
jgi:hypothetical protein